MPILIGAIAGVLLSFLVGATLLGLVGYAVFGALAGMLGAQKIGAVETFYWIMLLILVVLMGAMFMGAPVSAFLVLLPVVMMVARLVSVWGTALIARFQS